MSISQLHGPLVTWYLMKLSIIEEDLPSSDLASEILLRILLARLSVVSIGATMKQSGLDPSTLAGFPTFCPMTFHLLASYSLMAASRAALYPSQVNFVSMVWCLRKLTSSSAKSA